MKDARRCREAESDVKKIEIRVRQRSEKGKQNGC